MRESGVESHYCRKRSCLEARSANERTIYVGLGHQEFDVIRFYTAAIEDAQRIGDRLIEHTSNQLADEGVYLLSLGVTGGFTGADCPHRLVGDDYLSKGICGKPSQTALNL